MKQKKRKEIFRPGSLETKNLIQSLNEKNKNIFFLPFGFICPEAGQVGYLLNEYYNQTTREKNTEFNTYFTNSRYEALNGAIKIARFKTLRRNKKESPLVLVNDPGEELSIFFDPLERGEKEALVPGHLFFSGIQEVLTYLSGDGQMPIAIIIRIQQGLSFTLLNDLFNLAKDMKVITILDLSSDQFQVYREISEKLTCTPDIIVAGEELTNHEIPFGSFSMSEETFRPWGASSQFNGFISTYAGNRLVLSKVREYLFTNFPYLGENSSIVDTCNKIAADDKTMLTAFCRYVNPGLKTYYSVAGLNFNILEAKGAVLTIEKKGEKEEILDFGGGGGVLIRGHNPPDIIPEVLEVHDKDKDYWKELCKKMCEITGLNYGFPSVSGTTSVEIALIMAMLANKDKSRIIIFKSNYSGSTLLSLIGTELGPLRIPYNPLYYDIFYIDPFAKDAKNILLKELESKNVALIWFEVLQGRTGKYIPGELLDIINSHKQEAEYIVGVDEVLGGFYRTGKLFSFQGKVMSPDIITFSKGLSNSTYPMGMTMFSSEVFNRADAFKPDVVEFLKHLYVNQLGSHISLHFLEKITTNDFKDHVEHLSKILKSGMNAIAEKSPYFSGIGEAGTSYFRFNFEYKNWFLRMFGNVGKILTNNFFSLYFSRVCMKRYKMMVFFDRLIPPLTITVEEANKLVANLKKVLTKRIFLTALCFPVFAIKSFLKIRKGGAKWAKDKKMNRSVSKRQ
jgi:acetylornithine/succinyldiaminopimelate/putrescine aminotransferase